jgi:hypothetical protein
MVLHMKTNIHIWYFSQFFLEWEMSHTKSHKEIRNTHNLFKNFFQKCWYLWDNVEKFCRAGQATDDIWGLHILHRITKATNTCLDYVILIAFPLQQWWHIYTSMLHQHTLHVLLQSNFICTFCLQFTQSFLVSTINHVAYFQLVIQISFKKLQFWTYP